MRSSTIFVQCAALLGCAAAQSAYLYTVDQNVHSSSTASINSETASSIIARRRGLTDSRYLRIADDSILQELNMYGGYQQPLFGEGSGEGPGKLFIRISGFDGDIFSLDNAMPDLWIEEPARDLRDDFGATTYHREGICEYSVPPSANHPNSKGVEIVFSYPLEGESSCLPSGEIPHIPVILSLHSVLPADASTMKTAIGPLTRILRHLSATQNVESTLLLLPSKFSKSKTHHHNKVRAEPEETPLDLPSAPVFPVLNAASNVSSNFTLPKVIPVCFTSQSGCENTTNFCSGHGSCYKAHNGCYKCKCGTTVSRYNSDGTNKTVQWGGNACHKKDISVPFILFASFGVAMAALVAGSIGMLYSMGAEELPSVLGAGVAGPTAQK